MVSCPNHWNGVNGFGTNAAALTVTATGYIRGGCSPVGMKKEFPTYIDETAMLFEAIAVSGGMRGVQLIVNPDQLLGFVKGEYVDLTA